MAKKRIEFCLICLLLAGVVFPLAAQTNQTVSVYLQPVTGTGVDQRDNNYLYWLIYPELEAQDYIRMIRYSTTSDYTLIGTILPMGKDPTSSFYEYRFVLSLQDNRTGQILLEQRYTYSSLDYSDIAVKAMLENIYKQIKPVPPVQPILQSTPPIPPPEEPIKPPEEPIKPPDEPVKPPDEPVKPPEEPIKPPDDLIPPIKSVDEGDWREKWLFLGLSAGLNYRIYRGEREASNINPVLEYSMEFQFMDSVSVETGLGVTREWIKVEKDIDLYEDYPDLILEVPLLVKIALRPGDIFFLEPYSGVGFNISLFRQTRPSPVSWVAGYQHGVKAGPGALLFDFRFAMNLGKSSVTEKPGIEALEYQRYSMAFSVGYKYGILPKQKR